MKIGNVELKENVFLAPMAGVTDMPYRILAREMGASLVYGELISAKGIVYNNKNTLEMLTINPVEKPVVMQIFGSDPIIMREAAKKIEHLNFDILDINIGCPAPKIVKNGEGSALMKNPKLVGQIIKAISTGIKKPVTGKIRKGFDDLSINAVEVAKQIEGNGGSAVAVHGRTREQFYSGVADWSIIKDVKDAVKIPVIGNGDVDGPLSAKKMLLETNCDAVMVGRACEGNPFIFREIIHYLKTDKLLELPTSNEKIQMALRHAKMLIEFKGEYVGVREMRKHIGWYIKNLKNSAKLRQEINKATSFSEFEILLLNL